MQDCMVEIKSIFRRKKLHRSNQGSKFLRGILKWRQQRGGGGGARKEGVTFFRGITIFT